MKKSGYCTIFHIYLIFFLSLLGTVITAASLFYLLIAVKTPAGINARSDWPKTITENFKEYIVLTDGNPQILPEGLELLQENKIGLQIIDYSGNERFGFQKPDQADPSYSAPELFKLYQTGILNGSKTTAFVGTVTDNGNDYAYILYFPMTISKITMYLNGDRFSDGKTIILLILGMLFSIILIFGILYGFWTTHIMNRLTTSIREISSRNYLPVNINGAYKDLYLSLNTLDSEIKESDRLREQTDTMRKEWIANITHDLKTPLSPIKGYAELLQEDGIKTEEQRKQYSQVILKNVSFMESLIHDLKLTYQLDNGMIPLNLQEQNFIRFLKELVIELLNNPEYEQRTIGFESSVETFLFTFDPVLLTRVFQNIILNSFVHGDENTTVSLQISVSDTMLLINVSDNGMGMSEEETHSIFQRYYRGTNTEPKSGGTGLGLAIAKSITELHGGIITVSSTPLIGTSFHIQFPIG